MKSKGKHRDNNSKNGIKPRNLPRQSGRSLPNPLKKGKGSSKAKSNRDSDNDGM